MEEIQGRQLHRVLFVERTTWLGGSAVSLDGLLKGLDTRSYQPLILTRPANSFRKEWEKFGEIILEQAPPWKQPVRGKRDVAGALKRTSPAAGRLYVQIKDFLTFLRKDWRAARRLARIFKDRRIDLIHNNNGLPFDRAAVTASWLAGVNQVCHFRAFAPLSPIDRWLARKVQAHICVSQAVKEFLTGQGIPDSRIHVVYNPIDLDAFGNAVDAARIRRDLGLESSDIVITNVGRLDWWKGHDVFVEAIRELRDRWPNLRALLVGDRGPTRRSMDYCEQLRRTISAFGLRETVVFAGPRRDIPSVMAASDILVHSATEPEPLGRVIMEGMAAGRAVIATAGGGVTEIVKDRDTGLLVPPGNADAIVDGVELLLHEPLLRARIGQNAQAYARRHFSIQNHWDSVHGVYQLVMQDWAASSRAKAENAPPAEQAGQRGIPR